MSKITSVALTMSSGYGSNEANESRRQGRRISPFDTPAAEQLDNELDTWRSRMISEVGTDVKAVFRDFPRMIVFVNSGMKNNVDEVNANFLHNQNYPVNQSMKSSFCCAEESASPHTPPFLERCARVKHAVLLIMELCGEFDVYGNVFEEAWEKKLCESHSQTGSHDAADIHSLLEHTVMASKMIEKVKMVKGESSQPKYSSVVDEESKNVWMIHAKTFAALLLTVQSIMFYPSQQLLGRIRTPWLSHMQDSGWTIHLYPEYVTGSKRVENICVNHCQLARHYVEKQNYRKIPRFELEYTCTIRLNISAFERSVSMEDCRNKINRVEFELVACRLTKPRCSCFLRTWESRAKELTDAVEEHFGTNIASISA